MGSVYWQPFERAVRTGVKNSSRLNGPFERVVCIGLKSPSASLQPAGNRAYVVIDNRPAIPTTPIHSNGTGSRAPCLRRVRVVRHLGAPDRRLNFACFNVRSLNKKPDDLLEVRRDCSVDVLFLVETWHDADSVCIRRLRADTRSSTVRDHVQERHTSNHGGVAAVASIAFTGARLERLELGATPSTFELLCVRVSSGSSSCVVAVIYRPGSAAVSTTFYTELADLLDRLVTFVHPIYVVGDLNTCANHLRFNSSTYWPTMGCRAVSTRQHTTKAACWMSSLCVMTCWRRLWTWSTLVCSTIVCCAGKHR